MHVFCNSPSDSQIRKVSLGSLVDGHPNFLVEVALSLDLPNDSSVQASPLNEGTPECKSTLGLALCLLPVSSSCGKSLKQLCSVLAPRPTTSCAARCHPRFYFCQLFL